MWTEQLLILPLVSINLEACKCQLEKKENPKFMDIKLLCLVELKTIENSFIPNCCISKSNQIEFKLFIC